MTRGKTFKARVRSRMRETGESYMTAKKVLGSSAAPDDDLQAALERSIDENLAARARAVRWPQTSRGEVDTARAMIALATLFPSLRGVRGVDPWDALEILRWSCSPLSSGERHAGKFLLSVWNPEADWNEVAHDEKILGPDEHIERFDLHRAMGVWDEPHRRAFATWVQAPFWP